MELANLRGAGHDVEPPRGRLASLLYDATRGAVDYLFDDSISALEQTEGGVHVTFRSADPRTFGLVVGADGLNSNVRGLAVGAGAQFHRYLGYYFVGFSVDHDFGLDSEVVMHNRSGRMAAVYAVRNQRRPSALLAARAEVQGRGWRVVAAWALLALAVLFGGGQVLLLWKAAQES